jgi:hypothetical protein
MCVCNMLDMTCLKRRRCVMKPVSDLQAPLDPCWAVVLFSRLDRDHMIDHQPHSNAFSKLGNMPHGW